MIDQRGRMNFPSRHPLNQTGARALIANADVILGLEVDDFWGAVQFSYRDQLHRSSKPITKPGAKLISITAGDLFIKSNYQDFQRYHGSRSRHRGRCGGDPAVADRSLKKLITGDRKRAFEDRGKKLAAAHQQALDATRSRRDLRLGRQPHQHRARLSAELWAQIKDEDWSLVGRTAWPALAALWNFDKHYQFIGGAGGAGVGYGAPARAGRGAGQSEARPAVA